MPVSDGAVVDGAAAVVAGAVLVAEAVLEGAVLATEVFPGAARGEGALVDALVGSVEPGAAVVAELGVAGLVADWDDDEPHPTSATDDRTTTATAERLRMPTQRTSGTDANGPARQIARTSGASAASPTWSWTKRIRFP